MNRIRSVESTCVGLIIILVICAFACLPTGNIPSPESSAPVAAPATPAESVQDALQLPNLQQTPKVIFKDDFHDSTSGWTVFSNDFGEGKYENGSYFLKCTQPSYHEAKEFVTTTNASLTTLTSFVIDMDMTMLSGSAYDYLGVAITWPDINPMGIVGYEQPSDYHFGVAPKGMLAWCYSKQEVKDSSVNKSPGFFLKPKNYTCVKGINSVNNIKIRLNPGIRFMVNDYELVNTTDLNLDYVNRLIKDKTIPGGTLGIGADSQDAYSIPVFRLNKIIVYENN